MATQEIVRNYIGGEWRPSSATQRLPVPDPGTGETLAEVPLSPAAEVEEAVGEAEEAFRDWRRVPAVERVQYLFRLKGLLEEKFADIARTLTRECGKTLPEARGELRRGVENVEVACGIPSLMQGYVSEDIARGIDETMIRQPLGVVAAITPFNFPGMIPLWFLPYAIACGNTFVLKPSEKVPLTMQALFELIDEVGLPDGVVQLVNGARETVDAILDHPSVRAISFVGSTPVARHIYARAASNGKRVQCQGGAKNPVVVLPDADLDLTVSSVTESAFGCAGQRCLAASVAIPVGDARKPFTDALVERAGRLRVGHGLEEDTDMGPLIRPESVERSAAAVQKGVEQGASLLLDGRDPRIEGHEGGFFLRPTILDEVEPGSEVASAEIFGPVFSVSPARDVDEAIELVNTRTFGNMACLFTSSGGAARRFRYEVEAGNIGINLGVAAPMAFFPFSGWKESFFGDLHGQGRDAVEFYTDKKVVIERWGRTSLAT